jgi:hypothetical protein
MSPPLVVVLRFYSFLGLSATGLTSQLDCVGRAVSNGLRTPVVPSKCSPIRAVGICGEGCILSVKHSRPYLQLVPLAVDAGIGLRSKKRKS